jgi:uncharacterized phage protein (TIGR02220 family)
MSVTPWFKFYPGDYAADTRQLSQAEHGAYLLLMLDYYANGRPPPDDDSILMRVTLTDTLTEWRKTRKAVSRFFQIKDGSWHHPRIEGELLKQKKATNARINAALRTNTKLGRSTVTDTLTDTLTESVSDTITDTHTRSQKSEVREEDQKRLVGLKPNGSDYLDEAKGVLRYLNKATGRSYRPVSTNLNLIVARLRSGVTAAQLKEVVFHKADQWGKDAKMMEYLRPATLFNATKCEQYLGEIGGLSEVRR